ncbi:hypothetical protein BV22DRAFT_1200027 [Leucogyrophana mollusca]|uniref:Uncharacterized protein n=1 Tax=Leucogyrophana mollusca TaxID=85980 RepID=A0ACB8AYH8_9AGAM|nr:hypothetical protein BV22DRAFT_1200027 [Leucogyrophana mollusca]
MHGRRRNNFTTTSTIAQCHHHYVETPAAVLSKFAVCALTAASLAGAALGKCYPPTIASHNDWAVSVFTATDWWVLVLLLCLQSATEADYWIILYNYPYVHSDDGSTIQHFTGNVSDYSIGRCHKLGKKNAAHLESFTFRALVPFSSLTWFSDPHCYMETAMRFKNQKGDRLQASLVLPGLYNAASQDGVFKPVAFIVQ